MKKFSDLSREVDEDLERKIQELYDTYGEIDEALIKKLNLQALIRRAKKTGIRMKRMMKNPAFKQKIARSKKRMKSTAQLLVKAQKQARDQVRKKFYPKYDEMGREGKAKINQMVSLKHGPKIAKIAKMAKRNLPKVKVKAMQDVKRARAIGANPDA